MDRLHSDTAALQIRIARLRDRAEHCRAMAGRALSPSVAEELALIANSYERDAAVLEQNSKPV